MGRKHWKKDAAPLTRKFIPLTKKLTPQKEEDDYVWHGAFKVRAKRGVLQKSRYSNFFSQRFFSYNLLDQMDDNSPFGLIARHVTNVVRTLKQKDEPSKGLEVLFSEKADGKRR